MEAGLDHFAIPARMLDPGRRIGRKIRVFCEYMLGLNVFLQLHQEAIATNEGMQWEVRLPFRRAARLLRNFRKGETSR